MKRFVLMLSAALLLFGISGFAQTETGAAPDNKAEKKEAKAEKKEAKAAEKGKTLGLTGWVKTEGDKIMFVNDKDKQTWAVENPDMLKAHDGKHVKVEAKLNEANKSIDVTSVKDLGKRKQAEAEQEKK